MNKILKCICNAQIASDGGKNIEDLKSYNPKVWSLGYKIKDREILEAIRLINNNKHSNVYYYVAYSHYSQYFEEYCYIVYFNIRCKDGVKRQISFHVFGSEKYDILEDINYTSYKRHVTRWKGGIGGSREVAEMLLKGVI